MRYYWNLCVTSVGFSSRYKVLSTCSSEKVQSSSDEKRLCACSTARSALTLFLSLTWARRRTSAMSPSPGRAAGKLTRLRRLYRGTESEDGWTPKQLSFNYCTTSGQSNLSKSRTAAAHGWFNHIHQVATMFTPSTLCLKKTSHLYNLL